MSELRQDPITGEWVIMATERGRRPTDFSKTVRVETEELIDSNCPFCPGNESRTSPEIDAIRPDNVPANAAPWDIRVVPNRFAALAIDAPQIDPVSFGYFIQQSGYGYHEVVIESPIHNRNLADCSEEEINLVVDMWRRRFVAIGQDSRIGSICIFRLSGTEVGVSLSHPHSQIMGLPIIYNKLQTITDNCQRFNQDNHTCPVCAMFTRELDLAQRVVCSNNYYLAIVPFASKYPFQIRIIPNAHRSSFGQIQKMSEIEMFSSILKECLERLAKLLDNPGYRFCIYSRLPNEDICFHWFAEIQPHLTRNSLDTLFGFEVNPVSPEMAAATFQELS